MAGVHYVVSLKKKLHSHCSTLLPNYNTVIVNFKWKVPLYSLANDLNTLIAPLSVAQ